MRIKYIIAVLIFVIFSPIAYAQSAENIAATYPNQEEVFLQYNQELTLSIKDGEVVSESNNEREMMVLSKQNATAYARYKIYQSSFNNLVSVNGYSKIPDGKGYKKLKIGEQTTTGSVSRNVFYDDTQETTFDFQGITTNAVQYVQYKMFNKDAHLLSPFYLNSSIPVISATYTVIVPNEITIKYMIKNDAKGFFKFSEEKRKKETIYKWVVTNYKADKQYDDAPDNSFYEPHVIVYVSSYMLDGKTIPFLDNLAELYKWNYAFTKKINLTPEESLKKIVDSLTKGKKDDEEKARVIYKWVQKNIKYIAFEAGFEGFTPRQASDVCFKRYGDCKDMSSIITTMLKMASIKAYYTWIGTRDIAYKYTEVPLPIVSNHMISTANINNKWVFLDGTNPHAMYGTPPAFIQDKEALIAISDNEYKVLTVPIAPPIQNGMIDSTFISFTTDGIKGNEKVTYFGYLGEDHYNSLLYKNEDETKIFVKSRMGKASNKFILGKYNIDNSKIDDNKLGITADFEIPGVGKNIGKEYYINLNLEKLFENETIDIEKRKIPVAEDYTYTYKQFHILEIPTGYKVSYTPKDFIFEIDLVALKIKYETKNNIITAYQEVQKKKLIIYPEQFAEWNKAASEVAIQYKEQVVLESK